MNTALVAYIPVLHEGYRRFLERHGDCDLYLINKQMLAGYRPLEKDIRALETATMRTAIRSLEVCANVEVLTVEIAECLASQCVSLILPDEDVSRMIVERFFERSEVEYDNTFLRWDRENTVLQFQPGADRVVSIDSLSAELLGLAIGEGKRSADWWRQVGAAIRTADGRVFAAHNRHLPTDWSPYVDGDPRANFYKGVHLELSTAIHAEAGLIAEAARKGIALGGASMYVTDFPCPPCAKLIAVAGFKQLAYIGNYAVLDGESVLRDACVEVIKAEIENPLA